MTKNAPRALVLLSTILLTACWDGKPAHYYVMCEGKDGNGWDLVDTESKNGYLMACTYRSPDQKQAYTVRCTGDGCD